MSAFQTAIEAVLKPLEFAAHDDFAHIDRVADLEATVVDALRRTLVLAIPPDGRDALSKAIESLDRPLVGAERKAVIRRLLASLHPLADGAWSEAALALPTTVLAGIGP